MYDILQASFDTAGDRALSAWTVHAWVGMATLNTCRPKQGSTKARLQEAHEGAVWIICVLKHDSRNSMNTCNMCSSTKAGIAWSTWNEYKSISLRDGKTWIGPVLSPHTISAVCAARANGLCISISNLSSISCMQAAMLKDMNFGLCYMSACALVNMVLCTAFAYCSTSCVRLSATFLSQFCKVCAALNSALSIPCALSMPDKDYTLGFCHMRQR